MDGLWRGEKNKREREAIYKHEEVLGSGRSHDKNVTTPTESGGVEGFLGSD